MPGRRPDLPLEIWKNFWATSSQFSGHAMRCVSRLITEAQNFLITEQTVFFETSKIIVYSPLQCYSFIFLRSESPIVWKKALVAKKRRAIKTLSLGDKAKFLGNTGCKSGPIINSNFSIWVGQNRKLHKIFSANDLF